MQPDIRDPFLCDTLDLLALLFAGPGDGCAELVERHLPSFAADIEAAPPTVAPSLQALLEAWSLPPGSTADTFCRDIESEYVALFVNTKGGVAAPPYASVYEAGSSGMKGKAHAAMKRRLQASGLELDAQGEPADHLAVELEYLRHLLLEGEAGAAGAFAVEMLEWTRPFAAALRKAEPGPPFASAAEALLAILGHLAQEQDEPLGR